MERISKNFWKSKRVFGWICKTSKRPNRRNKQIKKRAFRYKWRNTKKDKIIRNWLRKQLEDEINYNNYQSIIEDLTQEKRVLEERKNIIEKKLEWLKGIEKIKEIIESLSKIYNAKFWKLDNEEKEMFIKKVITKIEIWLKNIKVFGIVEM